MLSVQELEYVKSLINTYMKQDYKYYLCCTNSDNNIDTDIYLLLSKEEIQALNDTTFRIKNGIKINIDTSYSYNMKYNVLSLENSIPGGIFIVDKYEYIYTNGSYSAESSIIYPDILYSASDSYNSLTFYGITLFMLVSIFIYMFVKSILRLRR